VLIVLVILVLGLNLWHDTQIFSKLNPLGVIIGERSQEEYLDDALGWYSPAMRSLHELPPGSRTIFLWEPRGLYAPLNSQPDVWIDRWHLARDTQNDPQAILDSWRQEGFTHLLIYKRGEAFEREQRAELTPKDWEAFDELLADLPPPVKFGAGYALYYFTP
jgi:hypothetical protein